MNSSRKDIIIKEILYWKEHNMLPHHYCDYLLALYSEGEFENSSSTTIKKPSATKKIVIFLFLISLILIISVFVIYFTELVFVLQTMILTTFVVFLLIIGIYYTKKELWYPIFYVGAALLLLLGSVNANEQLFQSEPSKLYISLFLNCLLWLLAGWKLKLIFFIFSGIVGIITLIIYMLI